MADDNDLERRAWQQIAGHFEALLSTFEITARSNGHDVLPSIEQLAAPTTLRLTDLGNSHLRIIRQQPHALRPGSHDDLPPVLGDLLCGGRHA